MFMRTFFIQSTWNFERMQNLGFCYAILPVLRQIYKKDRELREALKRHLEFFNTHPYMASTIIGAVAKMEEDVSKGTISADEIKTLKTAVMGSCGAIGDSFFWGALKPCASIAGMLFAALGQLSAPILFLLLYNIPHMFIKTFGFYNGYREGIEVFDRIKNVNFPTLARRVKLAGVMLSGAVLAVFAHSRLNVLFPESAVAKGIGILVLFFIIYGGIKKGISVQMIIYFLLILSLGSALLI